MEIYDDLINKIDEFINYLNDIKAKLKNNACKEEIIKNDIIEKTNKKTVNETLTQNEINFANYLTNERHLNSKSIKQYLTALKQLKPIIISELHIVVKQQITDIFEVSKINEIIVLLQNNETYITWNQTRHNLYSAAINNYCRYLKNLNSNLTFYESD